MEAIRKAVGFAETVNKPEGQKTEAALYAIVFPVVGSCRFRVTAARD